MKKVIIILSVLGILALLVWSANKFLLSGRSSFQSVYMIPPDAVMIIESDAVFDAWNQIIHSDAWERISRIHALAELNREIQSVDSLLSKKQWLLKAVGKRKVFMSMHPYALGEYDYLYILNVGRAARMRNPETMLTSLLGDGFRVTSRTYKENTILELLDEESGELYIFSFVNDKIILSTNYKLVEASLDERDKMRLGRNLDFIDVSKRISGKGLFNVYINYATFPNYLRHILGKTTESMKGLDKELRFSAFTFNIIQEGMLTLEGYTAVNDTVSSFYNSVLQSGQGKLQSSHIIPARVASLVKISFDDALEYFQQSMANLSEEDVVSYQAQLTKLERKLKISLEENFLSWMDGEIVLLQTQPSNLGRSNEFAAIIKAKNDKVHKENMIYVARQIERNMPVKIREVNYEDHTISYISFPGLLKTLFGKMLEKIEKPYFTYIEDYIVFSNHPQTLKNIIDDYKAENTLENSIDYYNFQQNFDKANSAFSYFDIPVLYNNLQQFVDYKTWQDLSRNKPYITSFPQLGVQIDSKDGLLHLLIRAEYKGYTEEFREARFDTDALLNLFGEDEVNREAKAADPHANWDSPKIIIHDLDDKEALAYYENKQLKYEADLKNGVKHGSYKAYYENGELMVRGRYRDDKRDGKWKLYDNKGNLIEEKLFFEGNEVQD